MTKAPARCRVSRPSVTLIRFSFRYFFEFVDGSVGHGSVVSTTLSAFHPRPRCRALVVIDIKSMLRSLGLPKDGLRAR